MLIIFSNASSLFFTGTSKTFFPSINTLKSFTSTFGTQYFEKDVLCYLFSNDKTDNLLFFVNLGSIKWFKWLVLVWLVISHLYLFHLIVLLSPDFNCSKRLWSSIADKVTSSTYNFVSVSLNIAFVIDQEQHLLLLYLLIHNILR